MNFDSKMPIYLQIMDEIKRWIVTDVYQPSQKIPSVRELAVEFGVNPNTVQRALSELERSGLVASERTSGRFICNDTEMIRKLKEDVICRKTDMFIEEIRQYGCDDEAIIATVEERLRNGKAD